LKFRWQSSVFLSSALSAVHFTFELDGVRERLMLKSPTVTKLEVISDAIKIGLPSLLTGLTAFFIARATRSHELEKESRRRRQDALEKISDDFQAAYFSLEDLLANYSTYVSFWNDPVRHTAAKGFWKSAAAIDAAIKNLYSIEGRLKLLQLKKCEETLGEYVKETIAAKIMLKFPPHPNVPTQEMIRAKFNEMKRLRTAVERSLADGFDSL